MTKVQQDFTYYTGTDANIVYTITDGSGASVDVSSASAWWLMQDEPNSGSLILKKTGGSGITVSGCTATVSLAASDTSGCSLSGTYYSELSASIGGTADIMATGYVTIHRRGY